MEDDGPNFIKQGPVKFDSKAILNFYDKDSGMVNVIDSLGNDINMPIYDIPNKIRENTIDAS